MRYEICDGVIRDTQGEPGDVVCVAPDNEGFYEYPHSVEKWPENARKIVAALNWVEATGLTFEQVENTLAAIERSRQPIDMGGVFFKDTN